MTLTPATIICPICRNTDFEPSENGFLFKKTILVCRTCRTRLEQVRKGSQLNYRVEAVGPAYTNCASLLRGCRWSTDELNSSDIPVYSDEQLAKMVQGEIPAAILSDREEAPPFPLEPAETVIFTLDNVYFFEERAWRGTAGLRFSFRETVGQWQSVKNLPDPRRRDVVDTLDTGTLYITTGRYVFIGSAHRIDEPFSKVSIVVPYQDGMAIVRSNSIKIENYKGGYHWPLVTAVMRGLIRLSAKTPGANA